MKNSLDNNTLYIFSFNYFPLLQVKHFMTLIEFIVAKLFEYNFCLKESIVIHSSYKPINLTLIAEIILVFSQNYKHKTVQYPGHNK